MLALSTIAMFGLELSTHQWTLLGLAILFAFYMAWGIGANDVANAMGTSVGSGALTLRRAVCVAAVLEFAGAFLAGTHVTETIQGGIVNPEIFAAEPMTLIYGMLAALLAAGIWLQVASYFGWPVSTTHSIVGSVLGFGLLYGGLGAVNWAKVLSIVSSWVVSPLLAGIISYFIFRLLLWKIFYSLSPVLAAKRFTPMLVFFVFAILTLTMVFKGLKNLKLDLSLGASLGVAVLVGLLAAFVSHLLVKRIQVDESLQPLPDVRNALLARRFRKAKKHLKGIVATTSGAIASQVDQLDKQLESLSAEMKIQPPKPSELDSHLRNVERIFVYLQILSACFVAFAHGANDVANAIGPPAAIIQTIQTGLTTGNSSVPTWLLALGGVGIVVGLWTWGWRVIETIGRRLTELTPSRGFSAEFGAASTIVLASKLGLPISTTHTLVGAVLGVGMARGVSALNLNLIRDIVISWIVTIPAAATLTILIFYLIQHLFA